MSKKNVTELKELVVDYLRDSPGKETMDYYRGMSIGLRIGKLITKREYTLFRDWLYRATTTIYKPYIFSNKEEIRWKNCARFGDVADKIRRKEL